MARFCAACGTLLPALAAPAPSASPPQARPTPPPPQVVTLRQARLRVSTPRSGSWEFPLQTLPCRIGRRDPSQNHYPELDLADYDRGHASRRHAVIERRGDDYVLTDVGSVNGTVLNGTPLRSHQARPLRDKDLVEIGEVKLRFEFL